jgi:hypothetical protein
MDTWTDSPLPVDHCPVCGHAADVASTRSGAAPSPGDISACLACASALVFDDDLRLRRMTQAEFADLHPDNQEELRLYQQAIRLIDRRKLDHLR